MRLIAEGASSQKDGKNQEETNSNLVHKAGMDF
jgi:hypothetical protein